VRHASRLKPMGLYAPEGRHVASRLRAMRDVPLERAANPKTANDAKALQLKRPANPITTNVLQPWQIGWGACNLKRTCKSQACLYARGGQEE